MVMEELFKMLSCTLVFFVQTKFLVFAFCDSVWLKGQIFTFEILFTSVQIVKPQRIVKSLNKVLVSCDVLIFFLS